MAFDQKPNTGVLFRNEAKNGDTDRDYSGSIKMEDGQEFWLSAWINTADSGRKYMSLKLKEKDPPVRHKKPPVRQSDEFDDGIPF